MGIDDLHSDGFPAARAPMPAEPVLAGDPAWAERGVTVCLVAYNHAPYVRQALDGMVNQTYPHLKIVACDDGSRDGTYEILKEYEARLAGRMVVLTHPGHVNRGAYHTYSACLNHVDSPFFVGHASDDFWDPDAVEYWVGLMDKHPEADFVYGKSRVVDENGSPLYRYFMEEETGSIEDTLEGCFERNPGHEVNMFYRVRCAAILKQEPELAYGDLYHNALLFKTMHPFFYPRPVVNYRWHGGSSWQFVGRHVIARHRLQVLESYHANGVMADYLRPQTILLVSLLAAYANHGEEKRVQDLKSEIHATIRNRPELYKMPLLWAKAANSSYLYNQNAHVCLLSELPWAIGRLLANHLAYSQIAGEFVSWRETAKPRSMLKVLLLVALNGWTSFVARNLFRAFFRLVWRRGVVTKSTSTG